MNFKRFLQEDAFHDAEDFLHHVAEEEFPGCTFHEIKLMDNGDVAFIADCNDKPRNAGHQPDMSDKLKIRLARHPIKGMGFVNPKVYHENIPEHDTIAGVTEMARVLNSSFGKLNSEELRKHFNQAKEVTKTEGGNFSIRQLKNDFALYDDEELTSFITTKDVKIRDTTYKQVEFFTLEEYRKNPKRYAASLLYSVKEILDMPLLVDDAIFKEGWEFLKKIAGGSVMSVKKLNKDSGNISDFTDALPKREEAFIIENDGQYGIGFYKDYDHLPIGRVYYNFFEDL